MSEIYTKTQIKIKPNKIIQTETQDQLIVAGKRGPKSTLEVMYVGGMKDTNFQHNADSVFHWLQENLPEETVMKLADHFYCWKRHKT